MDHTIITTKDSTYHKFHREARKDKHLLVIEVSNKSLEFRKHAVFSKSTRIRRGKKAIPFSRTIRLEISFKISATSASSNIEAFLRCMRSTTTSGLNGFSFSVYRMYFLTTSSRSNPV